ncbi:DUF6114 domain-containing protein [Natrinema zhouii]|uniref:Uncharacterized protein n=1 Tax=Natrinema zhouii TaxID=1710539 RepID=A0A7D6CQ12_9EURY|nr:DUF6114 domain-containing protein [Natrinema zhouii]QLK27312.1 DUF6114 domain-containing protein [Natrinema zhouii]
MATQNRQNDSETDPSHVKSRWNRFNDWRTQRPFMGGVLLCLAGFLITWVPMQILPDLIFIGGQMAGFLTIGALIGVFVFLTGVYALYRPARSHEIGVIGVVLSIFSLFGSLGGLFVGMLLGILGGNLCIAWKPGDDVADEAVAEPSKVDKAIARLQERVGRIVEKTNARLHESAETNTQRSADE